MTQHRGNELPNRTKSYWIDSVESLQFPKLHEDIDVDVCIVGGGITGITAAYLLAKEGIKVALIDADKILHGTTGHTTAKLTAQHGLIYDELIANVGKSKAKLYYEAQNEALEFVRETVEEQSIECDLSPQTAYMYATTNEYAHNIQKEAEAYKQLGINGAITEDIPLEIEMKNAVTMEGQAQFHPLKYLTHLVKEMEEMGVRIYENSTAVNIKKEAKHQVLTKEDYSITAEHVLVCSHFPFYEGMGLYSTRMYAERSYVLAVKPKEMLSQGIYINADSPTRSLRTVQIDGEDMILVVGESHKTGQGEDTMAHYKALEAFAEETLGVKEIPYRWSAQDLTTLDKLPYIGEITSGEPNILIATGYRKWGMTNGTAAALLLRDMVLKRESPFKELFTPSRFNATPSIKSFLTQNMDVVGNLIKGKLDQSDVNPHHLNNDEAAIIRIDGQRKGVYKDENGHFHVVDTTCTHIGCEVEWNSGDRSWDCPCHGSRFSYSGDVIEGPAEKPLEKMDHTMLDNLLSEDSGY